MRRTCEGPCEVLRGEVLDAVESGCYSCGAKDLAKDLGFVSTRSFAPSDLRFVGLSKDPKDFRGGNTHEDDPDLRLCRSRACLVLRALPLKKPFGSFGPFETPGQGCEGPSARSFAGPSQSAGGSDGYAAEDPEPRPAFGWLCHQPGPATPAATTRRAPGGHREVWRRGLRCTQADGERRWVALCGPGGLRAGERRLGRPGGCRGARTACAAVGRGSGKVRRRRQPAGTGCRGPRSSAS